MTARFQNARGVDALSQPCYTGASGEDPERARTTAEAARRGKRHQGSGVAKHGRLVVEDLHMTYKSATGLVQAVQGVSFTVQPGEFYTLLGASGCGKITILRCIAGLGAPEQGRIWILGSL